MALFKRKVKSRGPNIGFRELINCARIITSQGISLKKLEEYTEQNCNQKVNSQHFWEDGHKYLIYLDDRLYVQLVDGYANRRKNHQAFCKTHRIFEKRFRVATWFKNIGRGILNFLKSIYIKIMKVVVKLIGKLSNFIGNLFNYNVFCSIFDMFNERHDNKYGYNYDNEDTSNLLGKVNEWSGIPEDIDTMLNQRKDSKSIFKRLINKIKNINIFDTLSQIGDKIFNSIQEFIKEKDDGMCLA